MALEVPYQLRDYGEITELPLHAAEAIHRGLLLIKRSQERGLKKLEIRERRAPRRSSQGVEELAIGSSANDARESSVRAASWARP